MIYTQGFRSPLGELLLAADRDGLVGVWFEGAKYYALNLPAERISGTTAALNAAVRWLGAYFNGEIPDFMPPLRLCGTDFRMAVWSKLLEIPYGCTLTYGDIGKSIAGELGKTHMSAQAIGGAVGHNPISIIIPCHRVIGRDSGLVGYAGGIWRKQSLLEAERAVLSRVKCHI